VKRDDIRKWNPVAYEIAPDPAVREIYDMQYSRFRELYPRTRDLMRTSV
jgi:xylulokinase